jgi:hypothetical protein
MPIKNPSEAFDPAIGEIWAKDSVATISVDSDNPDVIVSQFTTNGQSRSCTNDAANNKITPLVTGVYFVSVQASVSLNAGGTVKAYLTVYYNGVAQNQLHADRTISSTDVGSIGVSGYIDVITASQDIDVRANIDNTTARNMTVEDINLSIMKVSET